jgi:glycerol-3-phosphate acyltransferase PlsY
MVAIYLIIVAIVSYVIGAIPVGALVAAQQKIDIAKHGSGKTGTTNVLRTVGRRAAIIVLVGDMLKGVLPVLIARLIEPLFVTGEGRIELFGADTSWLTVASLLATGAVVIGHVWSIFLRLVYGEWHGGRGVATAMGAILIVNPWVILLAALVALPTILISRYVSLGSILGATTAGVAIVLLVAFGQMDLLSLLFIAVSIFVIVGHRDNIQRLLRGTERKLGERVKL